MGTFLAADTISLLYNLSHRTMVLYSVPRPGDMIRRGLVRKTSLIKVVGL